MRDPVRFEKGANPGTAVCAWCGKRTWAAKVECGFCEECNALMLKENEALDTGNDALAAECEAELTKRKKLEVS
jgi:hypothetical protein